MAITIDRFFRIWNLYRNNPYPDLQQKIQSNSGLYTDATKFYQSTLNLNPVYNFSFPKDINIIIDALSARQKVWNFFAQTIVPGSYSFNTPDMNLFRIMTLEWSASLRTLEDSMIHTTDAFSLEDQDVDKAIRGFGIDFVNQASLDNLSQRQVFLLALADLYKIKGSPESITKSLSYAGINNCIVREYWIEMDPLIYKTLRIRGVAAGKGQQILDDNPESSTYHQYLFVGDQYNYQDIFLTWNNFSNRLIEIGDPHWFYTQDEILNYQFDLNTTLKLPSLTPYFGIDYYPNIENYSVFFSLLENVLSNQLNAIISGNRSLVPSEIGVSGYNEDLTEQDLWITGYSQPISLVECFLAFLYTQIRYDEYLQYTELYNFLSSHGVIVTEIYTYPWAYQELIYWGWQHRSEYIIDGVITLDSILKIYKKKETNYYCSTNELIRWWIQKDPVNNYWNSSLDNNIPAIFFDTAYDFKFNITPQDTTKDEILYYTGKRNLDFKQPNFEYFQAIDDASRLLSAPTARLEFDNSIQSWHASNRVNPDLDLQQVSQWNYNNTYFDNISWVPSDYIDKITQDGSSITPTYDGQYPKSKLWNWGIDDRNLYICTAPRTWIRTVHEDDWINPLTPVQPTSGPVSGLTPGDQLGYQFYFNGHLYRYVSYNQWIRFVVETDWSFCSSPIDPGGHLKLTSDLARKNIQAKVDPSIAQQYISNPNVLATTIFNITMDPLKNPKIIQYDVIKLKTFINKYNLTIDQNGYLINDFSYYFDGNKYLYIRTIEYSTNKIIWVRKVMETDWLLNGNSMFVGNYKFPNLDLTTRYDSERLLRGTFVLTLSDLTSLPGTTNGGEILVSQGSSGYPETWIYTGGSWQKNPVNRINNINLGLNNGLIDWIDQSAKSEADYENYATKFLNNLSNYIKVEFKDPNLDIAGLYKTIGNSGLTKNLINFFKPKRARLLYFSVDLEFNDRLFNSIIIDDALPTTKLLQEINDYSPRNDGVFVKDEKGMYNNAYYIDDTSRSLEIPVDSVYGRAIYYLNGFEDSNVNGFYFNRPDLSPDGNPYYLNYHNISLTQINNDETIYGYWKEWIIAYRKPNLHWCDSLYINYNLSPESNTWLTKTDNPTTSSSSSSPNVNRKVIPVDSLIESDVYEWDVTKVNDESGYDHGVINQWNVMKDIVGTVVDYPFTDYPYSNIAIDHSGNHYDGILHNNPTLMSRDGDSNTCYYFDGDNNHDQYINISFNFDLPIVTLNYWFWIADNAFDQKIYATMSSTDSGGSDPDNPTHGRGYARIYQKKLQVLRTSYFTTFIFNIVTLNCLSDIQSNTWYNVYEEWNREIGLAKLYLNGVFQSSAVMKTVSEGYVNQDRIYWLGRRKMSGDGYSQNNLQGKIDNFKIFNNPLNEFQIKRLSKIERRPEPVKTERTESQSLVQWNPALCVDPINIRRVSPVGPAGYPESIHGDRIDGYNADAYNPLHNEFSYTFWKSQYPYYDNNGVFKNMVIHDNAKSPIGFRPSDTVLIDEQQQVSPDYNADYLTFTRTISRIDLVTNSSSSSFGTGYSQATSVIIEGGGGRDASAIATIVNGQIISIEVVNGGQGFISEPSIRFADEFGTGSGAEAIAVLGLISLTVPIWWNKDPSVFLSGPVHHKPIYMAIQHTINDCYPCVKPSCCDYYDVGCFFDGPTNPQVSVWWPYTYFSSSSSGSSEGSWIGGKYSPYNLKDVKYDENTNHHETLGFIHNLDDIINPTAPAPDQLTVRQYWMTEESRVGTLFNQGSTYCTPCDEPTFTPDINVYSIPKEWKRCGVFHNSITATNFSNISFNGVWVCSKDPVLGVDVGLNSIDNSVNDFPIGYKLQSDPVNFELVHVYHKQSGYYYWEVRQLVDGVWTIQLRTQIKEKEHVLSDIVNEDVGQTGVSQGHFLNGHDVDVVEDKWCDLTITPLDFIGKDWTEIHQVLVDGYFKTSVWIKFLLESFSSSSSASPVYHPEDFKGLGQLFFQPVTPTEGTLYICVYADLENQNLEWRTAQNNFEFDWSVGSEPYIRPDDDNNHFGYFYRNNYLYLYINTSEFVGWIRSLVTEEVPSTFIPGDSVENYYTDNWYFVYPDYDVAYRNVSVVNTFPNPVPEKEEMYVCGDVIPFNETYSGIKELLELPVCNCSVTDEVQVIVFEYQVNPSGDYIKIKTDIPVGPVSRVEHRFISKVYEAQLPLPSDFSEATLTSEDYYLLKNYLPLYLYENNGSSSSSSGEIKVTWIRDGVDYYDQIPQLTPDEWYYG